MRHGHKQRDSSDLIVMLAIIIYATTVTTLKYVCIYDLMKPKSCFNLKSSYFR